MDAINKKLAMAGFALLWLHPRTKRPIGDDWSHQPVASVKELERRYRDGNNIGVRLGKWSKVDGFYLHVLDLDVRVAEEADDAEAMLESLFPGVDIWKFPRVKSGSGGPSRHIYFVTAEPFPSKKLANSGKKFVGADGKKHWTWEIELFGTGKQVAIPPSVHPDTGRRYAWEREFDLLGWPPTIDADHIADLIYGDDEDADEDVDAEPLGISYREAETYADALDLDYYCEDREGWITVGMALHHEFNGSKEALAIWRTFSKQSRKYDEADLKYQWKSFARKKTGRPVTFRTIVEAANEEIRAREWENIPDEFDDVEDEKPEHDIAAEFEDLPPLPDAAPKLKGLPKHLLTVPGDLGRVVDYYNKTARRPQPQFAVQTALALGSVVLGRNWTTDQDNFSSLFFLNVAPTSSGKEHGKRVLERILEAANEADLVGPKAYTSEAGVMSALLMQPRHISISDEFGRYLASARASGNANKQDAQSAFMEIFGRLDGIYRGTGYSTHGMTKEQADAVKNRKIIRPALTIFGMTTPSTFYEALSGLDVKDGFLNRFLIVNSPVERQLSRRTHLSKPPAAITDWVRDHAWVNASSDEDDMSEVRAKLEPQMVTEPVIVPFAPECDEILRTMELQVLEDMNRLDANGMAELFGRTIEIAMRVALIVAVSDGASRIRPKHLEWARDYVFFYHRQMAEQFSTNIGRSEFEAVAEAVLDVIKKGGKQGATEREITRHCRAYQRLERRFRDEVLSRLKTDYGVAFTDIIKEGRDNNGRKRKAYVAPRLRD